MTHLDNLERYLKVHTVKTKDNAATSPKGPMPFLTISRQAGAGGHHMADALLEVFEEQPNRDLFGGWQVFDRRLCEMVADDPFFSDSLDSLLAEDYRTRSDEFFHQILRSSVDQRAVMERVFRVVRAVASVGKAIIIGRAGAEVTRDMEAGVNVRLIAPETIRIKGMMDYYGLTERKARTEAERLDQARGRLIRTHFKSDINDPALYDVVFNTGTIPIPTAARALPAIVTQRTEDPRIPSPM
jgi:cytidylate kinase